MSNDKDCSTLSYKDQVLDIITNLKLEGFIVNPKPFRDEMATLIYYNSHRE